MKRRRRQESPFSLFAFQDIITSVTGILLLMTLMVTLALITRELDTPTTQSLSVAADVSEVLEDTREEIADLQQRITEGTEEIAALADISPARVRRELHDLTQQIEQLGAQVDSLNEKVRGTQDKRRQWKAKESDLERDRLRLAEVERERDRLREERRKLEREDRLIYNPQQASGKTPWLVDVDEDKLLVAQVGVNQPPQTFLNPADFTRWVRTRDAQTEYFVLLVRPRGINAYESIISALHQSAYDLGVDLIGADQTVIDPDQGAGGQG